MNPYIILGISSSSSKEDAKKAFRKLAMKYHPDRNNGDDTKFKEIKEAYETIMNSDTGIIEDDYTSIFSKENRNIIRTEMYIHFKDAILGGKQAFNITHKDGKIQTFLLEIPKFITDGARLVFKTSEFKIFAKFHVLPKPNWTYDSLHHRLITFIDVPLWDLIVGGNVIVETLTEEKINLKIPPKTDHDTIFSCPMKGVDGGILYVQLKSKIPKDISPALIELINKEKNG